jgi:hypothetical protein
MDRDGTNEYSISEAKRYMARAGLPMRLDA